jgi:hypothetical protein
MASFRTLTVLLLPAKAYPTTMSPCLIWIMSNSSRVFLMKVSLGYRFIFFMLVSMDSISGP